MNNLSEKTCPLSNQKCLMNGCTLFNELLDGCDIRIINYNLYQLKECIKALIAQMSEMGQPFPPGIPASPTSRSYPRPVR